MQHRLPAGMERHWPHSARVILWSPSGSHCRVRKGVMQGSYTVKGALSGNTSSWLTTLLHKRDVDSRRDQSRRKNCENGGEKPLPLPVVGTLVQVAELPNNGVDPLADQAAARLAHWPLHAGPECNPREKEALMSPLPHDLADLAVSLTSSLHKATLASVEESHSVHPLCTLPTPGTRRSSRSSSSCAPKHTLRTGLLGTGTCVGTNDSPTANCKKSLGQFKIINQWLTHVELKLEQTRRRRSEFSAQSLIH